jgi:hypothetical protein
MTTRMIIFLHRFSGASFHKVFLALSPACTICEVCLSFIKQPVKRLQFFFLWNGSNCLCVCCLSFQISVPWKHGECKLWSCWSSNLIQRTRVVRTCNKLLYRVASSCIAVNIIWYWTDMWTLVLCYRQLRYWTGKLFVCYLEQRRLCFFSHLYRHWALQLLV